MPPSLIHQMREQQAWEEQKKPSLIPLIAGVIFAFAIGGGGVLAWSKLTPGPRDPNAAASAAPPVSVAQKEPSFGGRRLGRAETAPLLRSCVPFDRFGNLNSVRMEPSDLYRLLQTGGKIANIAAVAGIQQDAVDPLDFAAMWGDVADCVFRQNGPALCDPDNRALAVEAANMLVRQVNAAAAVKPVAATDNPRTFREVRAVIDGAGRRNRNYELQAARSVKDRVLSTLRNRVIEGRLIASDFGFFTADEIKQTLRDAKPVSNACS